MATKNTDTIHELTIAEIARRIATHSARRQQIVAERAAIYSHAQKNGGASQSPVIDDDEKAAREHAKQLLNGAAPAFLSSAEPGITLDKKLFREQRGIDIALKILGDKELVARTAAAVEWAETHEAEWRQCAREIVLAAIRLDAAERRARDLLAGCGDLFAVRLSMTIIVNSESVSEIPLGDLLASALSEGIVSQAEIRKASNVQI